MRFFSAWGKIRYFEDVTDANILALDEHLAKKGLKPYSKWNNSTGSLIPSSWMLSMKDS
jgi:hypothetical protein